MTDTATYSGTTPAVYDVANIRNDFPLLARTVHGKPLVYLDNAATAQKPQAVIDAISDYYAWTNSNVHRGVHKLSQDATDAYEHSRRAVQRFIGARADHEIIFTRGTTDAINIVAGTFVPTFVGSGDEILVTEVEHHSNIVPWQMAAGRTGSLVKAVPVGEDGIVTPQAVQAAITDRTKLLAVTHVSNSLGTINDIKEICRVAHEQDVCVLVDGAQAVPHMPVDVTALGCDFYCFSAHKIFGPTGIGVLYGRESWLDRLPPYQGGGGMIDRVQIARTTFGDLPHKFEAGTPDMSGAAGLFAAIEYLDAIGLSNIESYESTLVSYAQERLATVDDIRIFGADHPKAAVFSFLIGHAHPFDIGSLVDQLGIAVRTGHHCNQPLMDKLDIPGTVRASFALYNTKQEVDLLVDGLKKIAPMLS